MSRDKKADYAHRDDVLELEATSEGGREQGTPTSSGRGSTSEEEKRLVRKLDLRIMPMICIIYLFACGFIALLDPLRSAVNDISYRSGQDKSRECPPARAPARRPS